MKNIFFLFLLSMVGLHAAHAQCVDSTMIDTTRICPAIYAPVCGCDGKTYNNSCEATYYGGVTSYTSGPCSSMGCSAKFSSSVSGCKVTFGDLSSSSGTILNWAWDFGDGGISSFPSPSHTYSSSGVYKVCLTIFDSDSCYSTICDSIFVSCTGGSTCKADFKFSAGPRCTYSFTDKSTSSGTILSWAWDFGDGGTSSLKNPSHVYTSSGVYKVCLTILDSDSCSSTFCDSIMVSCSGSSTCAAMFGDSIAGCDVYFFDASTSSGTILGWAWDFGDGGTSSLKNPGHTYTGKGPYKVCLTIFDSDSCTSTLCRWVSPSCVDSGCDADFIWSPTSAMHTAAFTDKSASSSAITSWYWTFGDGGTSSMQNPIHTYTGMGPWTVCLHITDSVGCEDSTCQIVFLRDSGSAVEEISGMKYLSIFPNPAQDHIRVAFEAESSLDLVMEIIGMDGRVWQVQDAHLTAPGKHQLNITFNNLSVGTYVLRLKTERGVTNQRFAITN